MYLNDMEIFSKIENVKNKEYTVDDEFLKKELGSYYVKIINEEDIPMHTKIARLEAFRIHPENAIEMSMFKTTKEQEYALLQAYSLRYSVINEIECNTDGENLQLFVKAIKNNIKLSELINEEGYIDFDKIKKLFEG